MDMPTLVDSMILLQTKSEPTGPPAIIQYLPLILIVGVIWFLMIRPQQKRDRARKEMLATVQKNDRVLTSGGILGTVVQLRDDEVTLRVDETNNVRMRFTRDAIVRIFRGDDESNGQQ
jgi:preprotein translocase subunit YajC